MKAGLLGFGKSSRGRRVVTLSIVGVSLAIALLLWYDASRDGWWARLVRERQRQMRIRVFKDVGEFVERNVLGTGQTVWSSKRGVHLPYNQSHYYGAIAADGKRICNITLRCSYSGREEIPRHIRIEFNLMEDILKSKTHFSPKLRQFLLDGKGKESHRMTTLGQEWEIYSWQGGPTGLAIECPWPVQSGPNTSERGYASSEDYYWSFAVPFGKFLETCVFEQAWVAWEGLSTGPGRLGSNEFAAGQIIFRNGVCASITLQRYGKPRLEVHGRENLEKRLKSGFVDSIRAVEPHSVYIDDHPSSGRIYIEFPAGYDWEAIYERALDAKTRELEQNPHFNQPG